MEQAGRLGVGLHQFHLFRRPAGEFQIPQGFPIHREEAHRGAVLGCHVADGGPVRQRQEGQARTEELDELADHPVGAQRFRDGQDQVGGGGAFRQLAFQPHADNLREEHVDRLSQHDGFRFNAAHAPAQHPQAVDHGGVAVRAHDTVRIGNPFAAFLPGHDALGQEFEIDLVDDAGGRRDDAEVVEGVLAPLEELVAFPVALELAFGIEQMGKTAAELVNLDTVVNDQVHRNHRVDLGGIAAHALHGTAQGRQIHGAGHPREVLHDHAAGLERDFNPAGGVRVPVGDQLHVFFGDAEAVILAHGRLEQDLQRPRQAADGTQTLLFQIVDLVVGAIALGSAECSAHTGKWGSGHRNSSLTHRTPAKGGFGPILSPEGPGKRLL